jgi:hypothetical protein
MADRCPGCAGCALSLAQAIGDAGSAHRAALEWGAAQALAAERTRRIGHMFDSPVTRRHTRGRQ